MFAINVILTVNNESDVDRVRDLLTQCGRLSRAEPGCLRFEAYHSQDDQRVFILVERWESEQAWQDHKQRQAVQEIYLPQVLPLVERVPHISTLLE
jgi:quinol monooxygenase YgiN